MITRFLQIHYLPARMREGYENIDFLSKLTSGRRNKKVERVPLREGLEQLIYQLTQKNVSSREA